VWCHKQQQQQQQHHHQKKTSTYNNTFIKMGCASSTQLATDPHTGQQKTKTKLGGAYPGNRRQANKPYTPPASQFNNGQATAHFVNYGGGNALVLKQDNGTAQPQVGASPIGGGKQPEYIQVTLPDGVYGGQKIQVAAPDGRLNEIVVPTGFGPGSTFTVEFADGPPPSKVQEVPSSSSYTPNYTPYVTNTNNDNNRNNNNYYSTAPAQATATTTTTTTTGPTQDDGFASGFNNPNHVPHAGNATPVLY
jgi:hypothetical protein